MRLVLCCWLALAQILLGNFAGRMLCFGRDGQLAVETRGTCSPDSCDEGCCDQDQVCIDVPMLGDAQLAQALPDAEQHLHPDAWVQIAWPPGPALAPAGHGSQGGDPPPRPAPGLICLRTIVLRC